MAMTFLSVRVAINWTAEWHRRALYRLTAQGAGVVFDGSTPNHLSLPDGTSAKNGEQFGVNGTNFGVTGTNFNDTLIGGSLDDFLSGNGGDDSLVGGVGQ